MKFVMIPDSFKGSLTSLEITRLLRDAARKVFPQAETVAIPMADGGEGTVEALSTACSGQVETVTVVGPAGDPVDAMYALLDGGKTAVVEMAQASGLPLMGNHPDPLSATSFGTGMVIRHCLELGAEKLLIGLGGSATNDGGMGMLTALGARFTDEAGNDLTGSGMELTQVAAADFSSLMPEALRAKIEIICDVSNPLLGPEGATAVYGPQKGVTEEMLPLLEEGMTRYASLLEKTLGRDVRSLPGAGAAGGMGAALAGVLGAQMRRGVDAVLDAVKFEECLSGADLVITGEGRMDEQSVRFGKVCAGIARRSAAAGVPVIAVVGGMGPGAEEFYQLGETSLMVTVNRPMNLESAMADAKALYADAALRMFKMVAVGMRLAGKGQGGT